MPSTLGEPEFAPCPHCDEIHPEEVLLCPRYGEPLALEGRLLDGKFRFMHLLGEGGMGAVWKAENVLVRKSVAIKLMHGQYARDERTMERFRNEATAAGRIGNDHICDILDLGRSQLGPYIVMELMQGRSLAELIEPGRIDPGLAVLIVRQALVGLEAAHRANIIHRDLKPENLFLHEPAPGRLMVKLMDFGISKFVEAGQSKTGVGVLMGTPEYMSPEQAEGAAGVDLRTDIWAMGVILYRAVTGQEAFLGSTLAATLLGVSTREPTPVRTLVGEAPEGLEAVIKRCLAKNPDDRYASAAELSEALAPFEVVGSRPAVQATPTPSAAAAQHGTPHPAVPSTISSAATSADTILSESAEATSAAASPVAPAPAPSPGPDESWTLSSSAVADRPTSTLSEQRSPIWIIVILLVLGGVGAAFIFMPRDGGEEVAASDEDDPGGATGGVSVAGASSSGKTTAIGKAAPDTSPTNRTNSGSPANGTGKGASTAAGTDGSGGGTGGATDTGGAAGGDETGGGATGTTGGTGGAADDDGGDAGGASSGGGSGGPPTAPVNVQQGKVHRSGGLYTPRTQAGPVTFAQARSHCSRLKRQKFAGLSGWRLAGGAEIGRFKGKVAATRYWTSKRTAYNMFRGTEVASKPDSKARPFCVSAKK